MNINHFSVKSLKLVHAKLDVVKKSKFSTLN